jgi:hypothetical protein
LLPGICIVVMPYDIAIGGLLTLGESNQHSRQLSTHMIGSYTKVHIDTTRIKALGTTKLQPAPEAISQKHPRAHHRTPTRVASTQVGDRHKYLSSN